MNPLRLLGEIAVVVGIGIILVDLLSPADQMGRLALLVTAVLIAGGGALVFWSFVRNRSVKSRS